MTGRPSIDLTNKRAGKLLIQEKGEPAQNGHIRWRCLCDCGNEKLAKASELIRAIKGERGGTTSCGCNYLKLDYTGQTIGNVYVVCRSERKICGEYKWDCRCACGSYLKLNSSALKTGEPKGCNICQMHSQRKAVTKHGYTNHPLYSVWAGMKQRCYGTARNGPAPGYEEISVCDEWVNDPKAFIEWALPTYAPGLQLDRKENGLGYSPTNCRFVTSQVNVNNRDTTVFIEFRGQTLPLGEVVSKFAIKGLSRNTVYDRVIRRKWDITRALSTPAIKFADCGD